MSKHNPLSNILAALAVAIALCAPSGAAVSASVEEQRNEIRKMRKQTLEHLYRVHPAARKSILGAAGYAVFSNVGVNLIFLSMGGGSGVAHDNKANRDTFMNMVSGGIGIGLGVKDFRGVFVFASHDAFKRFVDSGWEASAQADGAAKAGNKGGALAGAVTVAPGVSLYQITENGLALQATIQGTKYYKNDELNAK